MYPLLPKFTIILLFSFISYSQVWAQAKIALVNSTAFQEKNGITKLLAVQNQVATEFKPRYTELETMQKRLSDLKTQLESSSNQNQAKYDEYEKLNRDMKIKGDSYQVQYNKRYNELLNPLYDRISVAMKQWCQQKGYTSIVDVSKDDKGLFLYYDEAVINQTTTELISHINAGLK
ncbi:MAG: OmpH family outer membrane protein [Flavisolibacter sp.]